MAIAVDAEGGAEIKWLEEAEPETTRGDFGRGKRAWLGEEMVYRWEATRLLVSAPITNANSLEPAARNCPAVTSA